METADVVVIGAGIAGASAAWALVGAAPSLRVVLLEAEPSPGRHATGRSAATLSETYGSPVVVGMVGAGRSFFTSPPAGFSDVPLASPRGVLWVAGSDASAAALRSDASAWGDRVTVVDADGARALVPVLRPAACVAAAHEHGALDLDVDALLQGFLRACRPRVGAPVTELTRSGSGWTVVAGGSTSISAGVVVDAAGAWAESVAQLAGVAPLGLSPRRRTAFHFRAPEGHDEVGSWPMVVDRDERFYVKPDAGRLLGSPADATPSEPGDARPAEEDVALAIERIEEAMELVVTGVHRPWAGLRTMSPDGTPVVGRDPSVPSFVWLAGQGGYGIKTAPAMAWAAASIVLEQPWPAALSDRGVRPVDLAPDRFRAAR